MGLSDRAYMQADHGRGQRSPNRPTWFERLRFWWWRVRRRWRGGAALLAVSLAAHAVAPAQDVDAGADWYDQAVLLGSAYLQTLDAGEVAAPFGVLAEEWSGFWESVQGAMASGSLEDLASLEPYAQDALTWMDSVPQMQPMSDWMRQRLDYFDVAASVTPAARISSVRPPPPPLTARGKGKWHSWLHVPAKTAPKKTDPPKKRPPASVRDVDYWKGKIGKRHVPQDRQVVIPRLKRIFREEGVPEDLVWMAETESTLNPLARSPAGAAGLFQFMPATAARFGLKLMPDDERLEPEKSARAAARYLRVLNGQFKDWPLAIAAYNAGEGRVGKALKRSRGKSFHDAAPHLPVETQMYVPKVLATISLREGRDFEPVVLL